MWLWWRNWDDDESEWNVNLNDKFMTPVAFKEDMYSAIQINFVKGYITKPEFTKPLIMFIWTAE